MTIAILATGDEIVIGDTLNTNGQQIAHALNSEGFPLGLHMTCGDNETNIYECIQFLAAQHKIILITGGLGPTSDDRTRYALAKFLDTPLIEFEQALNHIQIRLRHNPLALTSGNRQQSLFPASATLLPNPNGTAMGCYCYSEDKLFILLPGPPPECLPMFNDYVIPLLQSTQRSNKVLLKWRVFGLAEAQIADQIDKAMATMEDCETGYRLETPYVECKVRCSSDMVDEVKRIIDPIVAPHIIASPDKKASELLAEYIAEHQINISIQDNVTGGVLQRLIQRPANYAWLQFNNQQARYHFEIQGLEAYWTQNSEETTTTVRINYNFDGTSGSESHTLPYRSPLVIHIAAEWLSFRLFHLINQFH